ncbi:MAG TPA: diguanylate cyclase [Candidatus Acidoferrales bacterium]|nr:diguanylate cyclase [Candidatus Acidoferrales bacterium]
MGQAEKLQQSSSFELPRIGQGKPVQEEVRSSRREARTEPVRAPERSAANMPSRVPTCDLPAAILHSAEDAIFGLALDGTIVSWNPGAERLYRYAPQEAIGQPLSVIFGSDASTEILPLLADLAEGKRFPARQLECARKEAAPVFCSVSVSPVVAPSGEIIAASIIAREAGSLDHSEREFRHANKKLSESVRDLEQRNREMNIVQQLSTLLQTCLSAAEAHDVLEQSLPKLFPSGAGALFEWNNSVNLLEATVKWGEKLLGEAVFTPEQCWALRRGQVHRVADPSAPVLCAHLSRLSSANSICAPLLASGETLGVISVQGSPYELSLPKDVQHRLLEARQQLVEMLAGHVALALANLKLRESLRAQSIRDPVSGLFNRRYLDETLPREIHRASRDGRAVGIIMCDLDNFKSFNDTYGHAAGDSLLRSFGNLVEKVVRAGDIACRYGGDEFVLILLDTSLDTAKRRAELLEREFRRTVIQYADVFLNPGALSLGVSSYPTHGANAGALLRVADEALYRAKAAGGKRVMLGHAAE